MKIITRTIAWTGVIMLALLSIGLVQTMLRAPAPTLADVIRERDNNILTEIRNEHRALGYKFEIYHGECPLLVVKGPIIENDAESIEASLISALKSGGFIRAKIMYAPSDGSGGGSTVVRLIEFP